MLRVSLAMILVVFNLGCKEVRYDLCNLETKQQNNLTRYSFYCYPQNTDEAEYEISIHDAFKKGFWGISDDHLGNVDKLIKETRTKLKACEERTSRVTSE